MQIEPYLCFEGRAEEALTFYEKAVGAEVLFKMRFKESPDPSCNPPGVDEKIMHATFKVGESTLMASDGDCSGTEAANAFKGFNLSLSCKDEDEVRQWFDALKEGGEVTMPIEKTFFSPAFGMVRDRFGVHWMIIVHGDR